MMLSNVKISYKVIGGFAILLLITAVIGIIGWNGLTSMDARVEKSNDANELLVQSMLLRAESKNFQSVGDGYYGGREHTVLYYYDSILQEMIEKLESTKAKFKRQQDIDDIDYLGETLSSYDAAMQDYYTKYYVQEDAVSVMGEAGVLLINEVVNIIEDQNDKLHQEINNGVLNIVLLDRQDKLKRANDIFDHVANMRIAALKMISGEEGAKEDWEYNLGHALDETKELRSLFSDAYNIKQADAILDALEAYESAGNNFIAAEKDLSDTLLIAAPAGNELKAIADDLKLSQEEAMRAGMLVAVSTMIGFTLVAIIFGVVVAGFITLSIRKPLNLISMEAKEIAETGDLSKRATVLGHDEIGEMAMALNHMLDNTAEPIRELSAVAEQIAQGDLTQQIHVEAKGDIVKLVDSFKAMLGNLQKLIANITKNAVQSATNAEELSASAQEVNASMEQVSSTIQEVSKGAQDTSKSAEDAQNSAKKTSESALAGSTAAASVSETMGGIKSSTQDGVEKIKALGAKSQEIGNIIETINNISEQTNLLALNAAIEAARAGEAGKGFAVVADEVRKLAEESKSATGMISDLITGIKAEIQSSVDSMNQNATQVEEGSKVVAEALSAFESIPKMIDGVSTNLSNMSSLAQENAAGSEEVSASVEQVTASMQQVSASAQQMSEGAEELKTLVSQFRTNDKSAQLGIIDIGILDHKNWIKKLELMIKDKGVPAVTDHEHCRFGLWYEKEGKESFGSNAIFRQLKDPHKKIHEVGKKAVDLYKTGKKKEASKVVEEAEKISQDVVRLLEQLKVELS